MHPIHEVVSERLQTPNSGELGAALDAPLSSSHGGEVPAHSQPTAPPSSNAGETKYNEPVVDNDVPAWHKPGPAATEAITHGQYEGRVAVGDMGEMHRIVPRILPHLRGGHRPEAMVDSGFASEGLYVGAVSVRGPGHHQLGAPRQDHYAIGTEGDWFIGVVADGVSEGALSHLGAERAAFAAMTEIRSRIRGPGLGAQDWPAISEACRVAVRATALQLVGRHIVDADGAPVAPETVSDRTLATHVATTCDVVVCELRADSAGNRTFTRATICGDGSAYLLSPQDGWQRIGAGKSNELGEIDNSLTPLPLDPGPPRVTVAALAAGQALVLCTDGFGDLIETGSRPVGRYLFERWSRPLDAAGLLQSASFLNKNADDDRTAVILWAQ
ncbi:protein phosphatase 2C domain-containing protein [Rhodococcoides kroppenstedtii]|uniref:protein phosphatase 2C domain-containing protein n=1 Tax=Rhodococcoides kroppenstedtii TaxID=293050 RepID=UPI0014708AAD|nr:protein phosphatase 2C domain-containing protein [Rhodococcus kroppenstedtii]